MDPLLEDDYDLLDNLLSQGQAVQSLEVDPSTLETRQSSGTVDLELSLEHYEVPREEDNEDVLLGDRAGGKKREAARKRKGKAAGPADSSVTLTGKTVVDSVAEGVGRSKKAKTGPATSRSSGPGVDFGLLATAAPELPRARLNRLLDEAGMADERFVRRMVEDLKDAGTDVFLANNATPRENRARLLAQGMRVS